MLRTLLLSLVLFVSATGFATELQPDRNEDAYYLPNGNLGLVSDRDGEAYDPVSAFPEGGGESVVGNSNITASHGNIVYHFANEQNRDLFLADPLKYEPTYGGWSAWAMSNEAYAPIHPPLVTIHGKRAHYYISRGAKRRFDRDLVDREQVADDYWKSESGEEPRL